MDSIENKLKDLILSKYKSLREFTFKIDMPYSTFDTILKRGINKANVLNILKICSELNIDVDKLVKGIIEFKNSSNQFINNFNLLDEVDKSKAIDYIKLLYLQDKYKK